MAKLPRLNVTVTEEQHALLLELAELEHRSAASYLRSLLDTATPYLRSCLPLLRASRSQTMDAKQLQEAATEALHGMLDATGQQIDIEAFLELLGASDDAEDASPPPLVTRGSASPPDGGSPLPKVASRG